MMNNNQMKVPKIPIFILVPNIIVSNLQYFLILFNPRNILEITKEIKYDLSFFP